MGVFALLFPRNLLTAFQIAIPSGPSRLSLAWVTKFQYSSLMREFGSSNADLTILDCLSLIWVSSSCGVSLLFSDSLSIYGIICGEESGSLIGLEYTDIREIWLFFFTSRLSFSLSKIESSILLFISNCSFVYRIFGALHRKSKGANTYRWYLWFSGLLAWAFFA